MTAIIGVDVGVTTGVAWGIFNPALRDRVGIWRALARGRRTGWAEIPMGDKERGLAVCVHVVSIIANWQMSDVDAREIKIMIEDFQVRRDLRGGSGKDKLAPVFVGGMLFGSLQAAGYRDHVTWVQASTSKSFCSDARLKQWAGIKGVNGRMGWIRGKKHARDACRLVAVGLEQTV